MEDLPISREIAAIVPEYTKCGDCAFVYERGRKKRPLPVKLAAVFDHLRIRQCTDLCLLRQWAEGYTHQKNWVPLAFSWELVLVPFKIRRPRISGDGAAGYFNFEQIEDLLLVEGQTMLRLKDGKTFPLLWTMATAQQHLLHGFLLQAMMLNSFDTALFHRLHGRDHKDDR